MYPFVRTAIHMYRAHRDGPLALLATDVAEMRCWPLDVDPFLEMNNGRTLTLYDIGRFRLAMRTGLWRTIRERRWGLAVAGASIRYRHRIRPSQRFELRTRCIGWDARFIYLEQAMWRDGTACNHGLLRTAVVGQSGAVETRTVLAAMGREEASPELPNWVGEWIAADATRSWPPLR